jgi:protein-tyrosine phosphatase
MRRVLFVCLGNICRSPLAQGVLEKHLADAASPLDARVDSAATHAYHTDSPPDARGIAAAANRGIDISKQRARSINDNDFSEFDRILAMDSSNLKNLLTQCPESSRHKVVLFSDYIPGQQGVAVPDPYYGGEQGFEEVLDMLEQGMVSLHQELQD